jgi:hypothetical protein
MSLRMYQRLVLATAFIFFFFHAEAQMGASMLRSINRGIYDPSVVPYEGSPYLTEEFVESVVLTTNNRQSGLIMRYNIYDDNIELKQQNGATFLLDPDLRLTKIIIGTTPFIVGRFEYKGKDRKGFLELLDSGKVSLFAKMVVEHKEKEEPAPMKYNLAPERFIRDKDVFYYRIGDGQVLQIDKLKNLVEALPEKNAEAAAFVKAEKISKDKKDLIRFFKYYNSLF